MARAVVVGGGYGGMAAAARLAKLGHQVALLEASSRLGGALTPVSADGFTWDAAATSMLVPAVVRDLFRKSGRPLEDELGQGLVPIEILRDHRFADRTSLRLPVGSRAAQTAAFEALGPGLGAAWNTWIDSFSPVWETLRQDYFEQPWRRESAPREVNALLESRETLHKRLRRAFKDDRLVDIAGHPFVAAGHDLRNVPTWAAVSGFLEQCFGAWTVPGGMHVLAELLEQRLATRGVIVVRESVVRDLILREGRVVGVETDLGDVDADVVVVAIDPRRLPTLARLVERSMPAMPPVIAHLGLEGVAGVDLPDLAHETVLHGDPMLVVHTGGTAPEGMTAWTVHGRGRLAEDLLKVLARAGIDVRAHVVTRVDRSPLELVRAWGGSPLGVLWQGRQSTRLRRGPTTPVPGVYLAGAHANPGAGLAYVGLSAALVAGEIGPA